MLAESVSHPGPGIGPPEEQAVTYQQLLDDPATHPGLVPHLRRLADGDVGLAILDPPQTASVGGAQTMTRPQLAPVEPDGKRQLHVVRSAEEQTDMPALSEMATELSKRSSAMLDGPPKNYGASYFEPDATARERLRSGDYSAKDLARYIREAKVMCHAFEDIAMRRNEYADGARYEGVLAALSHVPIDKMKAVYHSAELSADLRLMLERTDGIEQVRDAYTMVRRIYDRADVLELWDEGSPSREDPTFKKLVAKDESMLALASTLVRESAFWPEGIDPTTETHNKRLWGDRFLERVVGLPEDIRRELQFDSYARTSNPDTGMVDSNSLETMLILTGYNVRELGLGRVEQLHEGAGITSIDYYTAEPLRLMCDVLDGKPDVINHLQEGDTTVVFMNAKGDYNEALRNAETNYMSKSKRTLFFEVSQPGDFYRYMSLLSKRGIKPSTIVMSAHGSEGVLPIVGANDGMGVINNHTGKRRWIDRLPGFRKRWERKQQSGQYDISQARGLARVVRDYMQDSRGVDDNPEALGRRRIIMDACLAAKPVEVYPPGWRKQLRRLTGHKDRESLAGTIARVANNPNLDIYANEDSFQNERTADGTGVKHFKNYKDDSGAAQRRDLLATKYALDWWGNVRSQQVSHIPLRRIDDEQLETELMAA